MLEVIRFPAKLENKDLNNVIATADKKNEKCGGLKEKNFFKKVIKVKQKPKLGNKISICGDRI